MELSQFIQDFASCFEDTDASEFTATTTFKDLDEWDSLTTLAIIGMCNKKYATKVTGAEIRESATIQDVYNLLTTKQ
ncbi:MAG: phosphopantetheine-binding protein [Paludibacter sp.]|jgi:acyl carrier protein|nr:phosphopantetheine-binding protein [Paludibacter sp.]